MNNISKAIILFILYLLEKMQIKFIKNYKIDCKIGKLNIYL